MNTHRYLRAALAVLVIWALQFQGIAHAATSSYTGLDHINRIINSTPGISGITATSSVDGVQLRADGIVDVRTSSGQRIPVPTSATGTVSKATLAKNAARLVRGATALGVAYEAYEVYNWIKQSGLKTCPPPDFFCKESVASTPTYKWRTGAQGAAIYSSAQAACDAMPGSFNGTRCIYAGQYLTMYWQGSCTSPYIVNGAGGELPNQPNQTCILPAGTPAPTGGAYTSEQELADAIATSMGAPGTNTKAIRDAIYNDNKKQGILTQGDQVPAASPLAVDTPAPVTTPKVVTKTETIQNSDGTTSTKKTEEQTTVTPKVTPPANGQPATLQNPPKVDYPTTTTITTTVTNNTTNVTNVTTETVSEGSEPKEETAFCKLYPESIACAKLGEAPAADKLTTTDKTPTYTPVIFASSAGCPAPIPYDLGKFGGGQSLSFEPMCNWLGGIRPIFIALGALAAAFIFYQGINRA